MDNKRHNKKAHWDKIYIRDLELNMFAGIYDHERKETQCVIVNVTLDVSSNAGAPLEDIGEVVSYEEIVKQITALAEKRHYDLLERFAEDIAQMCLDTDNKVHAAKVEAEKPDIIKEAGAVGVRIYRSRK